MSELLELALGILIALPALAAWWCVQWLLRRRHDRRAAAARAAADRDSRARFRERIEDARRQYPKAAEMIQESED